MKFVKNVIFVALLATTVLPAALGDTEAETETVVTLTAANFNETMTKNDVVLVKFYAPWCGHCKRMAPEYEKASKTLKEKKNQIVLGKVDATTESELATKHDVNEYPTILLFRKGVSEKYTGGRVADAIVSWLERMTGPAVIEIDGDVKESIKKESAKVSFVGEFASIDSEFSKAFEEVAGGSRQMGKFFRKIGGSDKIYVEREGEEISIFDGEKNFDGLKKFVDIESFFLFGPINGENYSNYNDRDFEMVWFYGQKQDFEDYKQEIRRAAKEFRVGYSFVWLDAEDFKGYAENNLRLAQTPGLCFQNQKGARFILPDPTNSLKDGQTIIKFLNDVKAGSIERDIKSEPIPEKNDDHVKVVVGKNFESIVTQKDKDVLLEIYAPWCGYCKSFEPIYAEFAEKMKDVEHFVVAKMDGIANDSPLDEFQYNSFPTIYFMKAGQKEPVKFDGARTVEGMIEYVKKHSTKPVTVGDKHDEL